MAAKRNPGQERILFLSLRGLTIKKIFMVCFSSSGYVWRVSIAELAQPRFLLMQTKLKAALLVGLSGALACLSSSPAKAGPNPPLVNCVNGTLDTFLNKGCTRGDKNIRFNVYTGSLPANEVNVLISGSGNSYTINITPDSFWSGAGSIGYTVEVNNTSTDLLASLSGAQSTSQPSSMFTGNVTATGANPGACGAATPVTSWSCATTPLTYPFGVVSSTVLNTWNAPGGLDTVSNSIRQQPVPGPLPLLGAGMAFRVSRKLRSRLKSRL
jgi:hypothetical protein